MPVKVSLQVFSGRENPTWELDPLQVQELRDRLKGLVTSLERPPGTLGGLGYQGFALDAERELDLEPSLFVHAGLVDTGASNATLQAPGGELERWLLSTAGDALAPALREYVEAQLPSSPRLAGRSSPSRAKALEVPRFEPSVWNSDDNVRRHNNCYNYASNKLTNTFAQPGRGSGLIFTRLEGTEVARAIVRDGVEALARPGAPAETPIEGHFIALVIWPPLPGESEGTDYHFFRLDETTHWSHKPGQTAARDVDAAGRGISDPATCDRGPYTEFVGYFHTFPDRIRIR